MRCFLWAPWNHPTNRCGSKNRYQNGTLLGGNMDQNLRNPSCLILSHTQITNLTYRRQAILAGASRGRRSAHFRRDGPEKAQTVCLPLKWSTQTVAPKQNAGSEMVSPLIAWKLGACLCCIHPWISCKKQELKHLKWPYSLRLAPNRPPTNKREVPLWFQSNTGSG